MSIIPKIKEKIKCYDKRVFWVDISVAFLLIFNIFSLYSIYNKNQNYFSKYQGNEIEKVEIVKNLENKEEKVWGKDYKFIWDESSSKSSLFYASKNSKKYYKPECKSNIKEGNKIFFGSAQEAEEKGYTLSKTCK